MATPTNSENVNHALGSRGL